MGGNFSFCIAPEQFRLKDWATEKKNTLLCWGFSNPGFLRAEKNSSKNVVANSTPSAMQMWWLITYMLHDSDDTTPCAQVSISLTSNIEKY